MNKTKSSSDIWNLSCTKHRRQIITALITSLGFIGLGGVVGWSSSGLPSLMSTEEFQNITMGEQSWIASLVPFGAIISSPIAGMSVDYFGRKTTIMVSAAVQILGWLNIMSATNVFMLYIGRFITGASVGALAMSIPVYIGDISECEIRGSLSALQQLMGGCGIFLSFILGYFLSWNHLALFSAIPAVLLLAFSNFLPESQRYYLCMGKTEDAIRVTRWLHESKTEAEVDDELIAIMQNLEDIQHKKAVNGRNILSRPVILPLISTCVLMFVQQFCGYNAMLFYAVSIFGAAGSNLDAHLCAIIVGFFLVVCGAVSTALIDLSGRRILLIISGISMTIAHFTLGAFYALKPEHDELSSFVRLIPVIALLSYFITFTIGFGPIPWVLMSELLPNHVIGLASSVTLAVHYICAFLTVFWFPGSIELFGIENVFLIFGAVSFFGSLFVFYAVPETKCKTLEEIQLFYGHKVSILKSEPDTTAYQTFQNADKEKEKEKEKDETT